jgi:hypothetical protein
MSDGLTVDHGTPRPRILIAPDAGVRMCPLSLVSIGILPDHGLSESWYLMVLTSQVDLTI